MASIFPSSPSLNDLFTSNGTTWQWNGEAWIVVADDGQAFTTIVTSPTSQTVTADSGADTLTFIEGTNIQIDATSSNDSITISSTGEYTDVDSIAYPDYIVFNASPTLTSASVSTIAWDSGEEGLSVQVNENVNLTLGKEIYVLAYNGEATTLNPGEVVMVNGAQGQRPRVIRAANTSDATSARTFGMVAETIASGAEGIIITQGVIKNIDTDDYNAGDILYLSASPGLVTTVKPQAPNHYVWVGVVLNKNQSSGRVYIKPQNGYELDEIHDVRITSIAEGDIIIWNSASSLWLNESLQDHIDTEVTSLFVHNNHTNLNAAYNSASNIIILSASGGGGGDATVAYQADQPDTTSLGAGALWIDSDLTAPSGLLPATFTRWTKVLSGSATTISGLDDNELTLLYAAGYEKVFINGTLLVRGSDYTATTGNTVVLSVAAENGDVVEIHAYEAFEIADTYTQAQIDSKFNNYTRWSKTYSASASTITGTDDYGNALSYTNNYERVFINGILVDPSEYTRTSASVITPDESILSGDVVEVFNIVSAQIGDTYTTSQIDAKYNSLTKWQKTYTIAGDETFTVTNDGSGAYVIDSVNNPTLNLVKGNTYTFTVSATGHPFWIQTVSGAYSSGDVYSTGTTNLGTDSGTITWTVPTNAPDTLYYVCQYHSSMQGTINLLDPAKITGVDDNFNTLSYTAGYEHVYLNGILLAEGLDYTQTNSSTITLSEGLVTNDVIEIISIQPFNVGDTYTQAQIDAKYNNYTRWTKTLSASATLIEGNDDSSMPLSYSPGTEQVYVNGSLIMRDDEYTASSGSTVVLSEAGVVDDVIDIISFTPFNVTNVYTKPEVDTAFAPVNAGGLVLLNKTDFTGASTVSVDNVFSADYDNYKFVMSVVGTGTAAIRLYLRDSGGDITGANYNFQLIDGQSTSISGSLSTSQTSGRVGTCTATRENIITTDMCNPFLNKATTYIGYSMDSRPALTIFGNEHTLTGSYTGIKFFPSAGTISGTIRIYGYKDEVE